MARSHILCAQTISYKGDAVLIALDQGKEPPKAPDKRRAGRPPTGLYVCKCGAYQQRPRTETSLTRRGRIGQLHGFHLSIELTGVS
jgi:hypothetical protein